MKRAVSVSLGAADRDHEAVLSLGGIDVLLERRGTDGDLPRARRLLGEMDGAVDALGLGGIEMSVDIGSRSYALPQGRRLAAIARRTPIVDGSALRAALERRVFALIGDRLPRRRFGRALVAVGAARWALAEAVAEVADTVFFGDLYLALGLPIRVRGLTALRRLSHAMLPLVRHLPATVLYPTGHATVPRPAPRWSDYDLLAGDFHYLRRCLGDDLRGKTVVTNTTTADDVAMLRARGLECLVTTTPRLRGRSFGTNAVEAALVARAGLGRPLDRGELWQAVRDWGLGPEVLRMDDPKVSQQL